MKIDHTDVKEPLHLFSSVFKDLERKLKLKLQKTLSKYGHFQT